MNKNKYPPILAEYEFFFKGHTFPSLRLEITTDSNSTAKDSQGNTKSDQGEENEESVVLIQIHKITYSHSTIGIRCDVIRNNGKEYHRHYRRNKPIEGTFEHKRHTHIDIRSTDETHNLKFLSVGINSDTYCIECNKNSDENEE